MANVDIPVADSVLRSEAVSPSHCVDDSELWFNDGTLVFVTATSRFRIYSGLLAKESPIFRDMLALPQPEDAETMDGCPVVRLPDDGRDVGYFLKALFDYKFFLPFPTRTNFDILSGIIRLSKKYEVDPLYKRALDHLASRFPLSLSDYPGRRPSWDMSGQETRAVLLARELALDWILPVAFYRVCANSTIKHILNGVYVNNERVELDPSDKQTVLEQYTLLRGPASADMVDFLWNPLNIQWCSKKNCTSYRFERRKEAEGRRSQGILPLTLWVEKDWERLDVCSACLTAMKASHRTSLERFWNGLPQRFGLPTWDELREMREGALHVVRNPPEGL
ncbi:hypothetical protein DFH07DRAFT_919094 [Mycena maculata]|uniref:BTB domain-containing protein n=1 Tax=Mycena maculata TaxID=230809 RepID=A0AAD7NEQ2_9AGAR|nr:hypothetical protein DFH07DRAFT_919094 [Mycena maculata]